MIVKTEGVVLKTFDYRETSRIARIFTKDYGKISGVLKGIRKDPRKFGSHLDKFSVNEVIYYTSRKTDLHLISQCDLKQFFLAVRGDYKRNIAANYILELVDSIMQQEQKNLRVYRLMIDYLAELETVRDQDIDKLVYIFQIKTLLFSGFRPHIDSCVKCQKKITGKVRFSSRLGGLVCSSCPTSETSFQVISKGTISSMLHIEQSDWKKSLRLGLTSPVKKELKYVLNNFLVYHLEKKRN